MVLFDVISNLFVVNGITMSIGLTLLFVFIGILMAMSDFRIGLIALFLCSGINFILQSFLGFEMTVATYFLFISLILMALSIFVIRQGGQVVG
jgi:hypothetical protein